MLQSQMVEDNGKALDDPNCLACFRSWSKYWSSHGPAVTGGYGFKGSVPRRRIWLEYYDMLSEIIKQDLAYPTGYAPANTESSARSQLRVELKLVEAKYEALLIDETEFPKAEEEREEVETFVELVMDNWTILNGRGWRVQDLGQGGREALSRTVLDLLYRASTRTFHSTAIMRYLFLVHLAVAEFDLAFKAFDAYLDLVKRGKARVEKTGHEEPSLDEDATVMETLATCIAALCRYGDHDAAEKARKLAMELEHWLAELRPNQQRVDGPVSPLRPEGSLTEAQLEVGPRTIALSWQAIGLAHAQWARMTFDAASRADIQKKAMLSLRKSLSAEFARSADTRGIFGLGLLLAEQRELSTAIELVKTALMAEKNVGEEYELYNGAYWQERSLIPLWHLLSLMLSARQDYVMAARACEAAFEQFKDPGVLFGSKKLNGTYRSDHLNEAEAKNEIVDTSAGVVDNMDDYEKESILEIKMTQLAIVEILEGPKVAVNASLELLSLFSRLFGIPQPKAAANPPKTGHAPKSSAGTLRSLKGSIFGGRSERGRQSIARHEKISSVSSRPQTTQTMESMSAPTIQITGENGLARDARKLRRSASSAHRGEPTKRASLRKRDSSGSRRRAASTGPTSQRGTLVDGESYFTPFGDSRSSEQDFFSFANKRHTSFGRINSEISAKSKPGDVAGVSVVKLDAYPALLPVIQFSKEHDARRRTAILIKIWLLIAGFYRRADKLDDSQGATAEAMKLVQGLEAEIARDTTGTLSLKNPGWAGRKSVEELWADVWSEVS
jgi:hypothetical protein